MVSFLETSIGPTLPVEQRGDLLPVDKVGAIQAFRAGPGKLTTVGDGVNDAPRWPVPRLASRWA